MGGKSNMEKMKSNRTCQQAAAGLYFFAGLQILLSVLVVSTAVFFISIGSKVEEFADPGSFLELIDSTEKRFTFTFVFSVKEMTLAEMVADIQWTGGWFIGVNGLVGIAAILSVVGTYKRLSWMVGIFTHLFLGRFVFDSIAFLFLTNAKVTTMEAWLALAVYIVVVIVWNLVGFLLFNFLEKLSDQLTEEKDQGQETLRDIIKRLQQEQD